MRVGRPWTLALALGLLALAAWRAACVLAGPDVDTDAYAHHMIARSILADPRDLAVHWVWLPLFHYLQVPLVAAGGTMETVRWINVALAAATPAVLFFYLRRTTRSAASRGAPLWPADATALLGALLAGACTIAMQMGTTAQPEPLFALLILGVGVTWQERRYGAMTALLALAAMLRYEAWAALATVGAATAWQTLAARLRRRVQAAQAPAGEWRAWIAVAVPSALILGWAALRLPVDGQWFGFLRQTRDFATDATGQHSALSGGVVGLVRDALYYPLQVPVRVLGPALALAPFGVLRTVRQQGARFVLVPLACLGFVSLTWIMRSSLGLDRHFVEVAPLYATFAAQGTAAVADFVVRAIERASSRRASGARARVTGVTGLGALVGRAVGGVLAVGALAALAMTLQVWMGYWKGSIERGWPERAAMGAYLRSLPGAPTIFCDEATLEILSRLDRRRFDRHWIDDPRTWDVAEDAARAQGVVYMATWRRKLTGHEQAGDIVFSAGQSPDDPTSGVAVMRLSAASGRAAR